MNYWREVPMEPVWLFSNSDNRTLNTLFSILHITAWCILLAETWIMDLPELFGLKQVRHLAAAAGVKYVCHEISPIILTNTVISFMVA